MTNTTEQTIFETIRQQRADEQRHISTHTAIFNALRKFEGKKLTRRVIPAIREALGIGDAGVVHFEPARDYMSGTIAVWGVLGYTYDNRFFVFRLGAIYNEADTQQGNGSTGAAAKARNMQRDLDLSAWGRVQRAAKAIEAYKLAKEEMDKALAPLTDARAISKACGI